MVPCRQDRSPHFDFLGSDEGNPATEGDTLWVNYSTKHFSSCSIGFLKVAFHGSRVTSDAGLILLRELDERLVLEILISEHLNDSRHRLNRQFSLADLLPQSVYSRLAGYEDLSDAVRVSADPTFRLIGSKKLWDRGAALTSTLHWFETDMYRGQGCGNNAPGTRGSSQLHVERGPS